MTPSGRDQAPRERSKKCRWCDKPGPYFGRCADHWDEDEQSTDAASEVYWCTDSTCEAEVCNNLDHRVPDAARTEP